MSGTTSLAGPTGPVDLRAKERSIVAALALHHPVPATAASLAPLIWGDELPATAVKSIHNHVSRIRTSAPQLIDTAGDGYRFVDGTEVTSNGSTLSYHDLADQPQVAVARARDRITAADRSEAALRPRVRLSADSELVEELEQLVQAAPQRLIRWWWLALTLARLGRRQAALDAIRECRGQSVHLEPNATRALDRFEQAIFEDDVFLHSPAAAEPRSLGADRVQRPDPSSTVAPVGIVDATGAIAELVARLDDGAHAVGVVAPAGGGKSSVLRSLTMQLPPRGWHCFSTSCSPIESDPLTPLADLDAQRRERRGDRPITERRHTGEAGGDWPLALLDALTEPSNRRVLLVVDDLHRASPAMREYVDRLAERVVDGDGQVALVTASRPADVPAPPTMATVDLPAWDHRAIESYLHSFVGAGVWTRGASSWIAERAGGNALFVRELSIDALRRLPEDPTSQPFVPPDVASMVTDGSELALGSLPANLRDTLTAAAVLGDEFRTGDLAGLVPRVAPMLALGQAHGLIERVDQDRHRFVHQRFRQSFLDLVDVDEQVTLAHRVAHLIGRGPDSQERLADVARFARTASTRDPDAAIDATIAEARAAFDALRMEEAVNIARLGMRLVDDVEGRSARWAMITTIAGMAAVETGDPDASDLLVAGGTRAIELDEHHIVAEAAARLSSQSPTTRIGVMDEATAVIFDHAYRHVHDRGLRALVCRGGAFSAALADDPGTARRLYREAELLSAELGDVTIRAEILSSAYTPLSQTDDVPARREISRELHRLAAELDRIDFQYAAHRLDFADAIHWGLADPREPMRRVEEVAAELRQRSRNWSLFAFRSTIALLDGDTVEAERHATMLLSDEVTTSQQLATTTYGALLMGIRLTDDRLDELDSIVVGLQADQPQLAIWHAVRSVTAARSDPAAATAAFDRIFTDDGHRIPANFTMVAGLVMAGEGAVRLGDDERMRTVVAHLRPFEDRWAWFNVGTVGPVDLTLARLHAALGDASAARACVRRGLLSTARVGAPLYARQLAQVLSELG